MNNLIFYFTGTGNSLQIAENIADSLGGSEAISLAGYDLSAEVEAERVGIVFPVYFWGIPKIVERFLKQLKIRKGAYVFAVANYGLWPGKALDAAGKILEQRSIPLNSAFLIKMPDNYILWYGAKSEQTQNKLFEREKIKIKHIAEIVGRKEDSPMEKSRYVIDRIFTNPVKRSAAKKYGTQDLKFSATESCVGCGLCEKICPVHNITLINQKPVWNHHCEVCLACIQRCPQKAIDYNHKTQNRTRYINPNVKF